MWARFFVCSFIGFVLIGLGVYTVQNPTILRDPVAGIMDDPVGGIIEIGVGIFFIGVGVLPDILFNISKRTLRVHKRILLCGIVIPMFLLGVLIFDYQNPIVEVYEGIVADVDLPRGDTEVQLQDGTSILLGYREYRGAFQRGHTYRFYFERTRILGIEKPVRYEEV